MKRRIPEPHCRPHSSSAARGPWVQPQLLRQQDQPWSLPPPCPCLLPGIKSNKEAAAASRCPCSKEQTTFLRRKAPRLGHPCVRCMLVFPGGTSRSYKGSARWVVDSKWGACFYGLVPPEESRVMLRSHPANHVHQAAWNWAISSPGQPPWL